MNNLEEKLFQLRLKTMAENLSQILEQANQKNYGFTTILENLIDLELESRRQQNIQYRFQQSKLGEIPTIDQFDFNFHVSRQKNRN